MKRCEVKHPTVGVQCHRTATASSAHEHQAWASEEFIVWKDAPKGPQSSVEFETAAWELSGGLGLEMEYDPDSNAVVVQGESLARWWDSMDEASREGLVNTYRRHRGEL